MQAPCRYRGRAEGLAWTIRAATERSAGHAAPRLRQNGSLLEIDGSQQSGSGTIVRFAVADTGTAFNSALVDAIPDYTTYVSGSLRLNGNPLSDAVDADVGEFNDTVSPNIVVRLGDLTQADGVQTIRFQVSVD